MDCVISHESDLAGGSGGGGGEMPRELIEPQAVFVIDDSLTELQKVKRYTSSQIPLQRYV